MRVGGVKGILSKCEDQGGKGCVSGIMGPDDE